MMEGVTDNCQVDISHTFENAFASAYLLSSGDFQGIDWGTK